MDEIHHASSKVGAQKKKPTIGKLVNKETRR